MLTVGWWQIGNYCEMRQALLPWYSPPRLPATATATAVDPIILTVSTCIQQSLRTNAPLSSSSSLKKLLPDLTPHHITSLLSINPLALPPTSLLSFFRWIPSCNPLFRHTLHSYLSMAHFLCRHRLFSHASPLVQLLVSRKGRDSSFSLFNAAVATSLGSDQDDVFGLLIVAYVDAGFVSDAVQCVRLAWKNGLRLPFRGCLYLLDHFRNTTGGVLQSWGFYSEILDYGFPPNVYCFNALMNSFCKEGKLGDAQLVFDEMPRRGVRPTAVSFNTLINGYCKSGSVDRGFQLKRVMAEVECAPDLFTYGVLINGLCKEGRLDDADEVFDEMCCRGFVPNNIICSALIDGYCKGGRVNAAMGVYNEMIRRQVRLDLVTYNALINGLCKSGAIKDACRLVEQMTRSGLKPDKITYTTLIDGCCKEGDLETATKFKIQMIAERVKPDDVAYTALITGLCREGRTEDGRQTLQEMVGTGIVPDVAVYTMVIDGLCKKGEVKSGFKLLKEMQTRDGPRPGTVTYNVIMNGLCKLGQMKNADMLLNAMLNVGVQPDDVTYNILLDGHCKHSCDGDVVACEKLRLEKGMALNYEAYTLLISEVVKKSKSRAGR